MKQHISQKYKSYKDMIVWTKDGKVIKPELVKDRDRSVQAAIRQVDFSDKDEYFPGKKGKRMRRKRTWAHDMLARQKARSETRLSIG